MSEQYLTIDHLNLKDITRIFSQIKVSTARFYNGTPCWEWTGLTFDKDGYGRTRCQKLQLRTHRLMYAWLVAPVPLGMGKDVPQVDHLCRNIICCAPYHLELVTPQINTLRSTNIPAQNARKTHCKQGHEFSGDNLLINRKGERNCRMCRNETARLSENYKYKTDPEFRTAKLQRGKEWRQWKMLNDPDWVEKERIRTAAKNTRNRLKRQGL